VPSSLDLQDAVLGAWNTSSRVTNYLVAQIPAHLWSAAVPGVPSRTIRAIAAHLHNARCRWIKTLGHEHGIVAPTRVDQRAVTSPQLRTALNRSARGIAALAHARIDSIDRSAVASTAALPLQLRRPLPW